MASNFEMISFLESVGLLKIEENIVTYQQSQSLMIKNDTSVFLVFFLLLWEKLYFTFTGEK